MFKGLKTMKTILRFILRLQNFIATNGRLTEKGSMFNDSYSDSEYQPSTLPADIILFCDSDASLFKAIVKHYSLEVDLLIAEELEYLNLHHRRRMECGLIVNYLEFSFYSHAEERVYRITRFDTIEDAARFLLSEPYSQRGAILVSENRGDYDDADQSVVEAALAAKALIRTTFGFGCVAVQFNEPSQIASRNDEHNKWANKLMDFFENGLAEKGLITRIEGSTQAMLAAKPGLYRKQKPWWCPSPVEQLQSMLSFFHARLPQENTAEETYFTAATVRTRHLTKVLTARFYCFDEKEGGSQITAMDELKISIAGNMVVEGHIVESPGLAIEPGKLCQSNVLILLEKAVAADSRDHFIARKMDGASVGVGIIISCG